MSKSPSCYRLIIYPLYNRYSSILYKKQPMTHKRLSNEITELERQYTKEKEWYHTGEVTTRNRPKNSLLQDIEINYKQIKPSFRTKEEEDKLKKIFLEKIREGDFSNLIIQPVNDDEVSESLSEIEEELEENDIEIILEEIDREISQMCDFNERIVFHVKKPQEIKKRKPQKISANKSFTLKKLKTNKNVKILK